MPAEVHPCSFPAISALPVLYDNCMGTLLQIRDLCVSFGAMYAVRRISLSIDEGEVLGLVGESGSGKSATALAILGLLGPAAQVSGQMMWRGRATGDQKIPATAPVHVASSAQAESREVDLLQQPFDTLRKLRGLDIAM